MVSLVEACRLMWAPGLTRLNGKPGLTMHEWLASANFAPAVIGGDIALQGLDIQRLLRAYGGDLNRVAAAGSESLRNIATISTLPKSLGWPYVKLYYSALFYSHALLRIWGRSPSYLRTSDLLRVKQAFAAYSLPAPFKIQTGQYILVAKPSDASLVIKPDRGGGGTHEAIWRELNNTLGELRNMVTAAPFLSGDKKIINDAIASALSLITNFGSNAAWLSATRNDIQYRQSDGLWFPYTGRKKTSDLVTLSAMLLDDNSKAEDVLLYSADSLSRFGAACSFVIVLARQTMADLSQVGGAKNFLKFGQAEFERSLAEAAARR